ncbi:MAG: hypothetical protein IH847_08760 [Acidobacteria bacterium]|nr:hypothetical protein [Acidobacteriota bacterium]
MVVTANVKELHRRWRRRELMWHWGEIAVGLAGWAALSWALVRFFAH